MSTQIQGMSSLVALNAAQVGIGMVQIAQNSKIISSLDSLGKAIQVTNDISEKQLSILEIQEARTNQHNHAIEMIFQINKLIDRLDGVDTTLFEKKICAKILLEKLEQQSISSSAIHNSEDKISLQKLLDQLDSLSTLDLDAESTDFLTTYENKQKISSFMGFISNRKEIEELKKEKKLMDAVSLPKLEKFVKDNKIGFEAVNQFKINILEAKLFKPELTLGGASPASPTWWFIRGIIYAIFTTFIVTGVFVGLGEMVSPQLIEYGSLFTFLFLSFISFLSLFKVGPWHSRYLKRLQTKGDKGALHKKFDAMRKQHLKFKAKEQTNHNTLNILLKNTPSDADALSFIQPLFADKEKELKKDIFLGGQINKYIEMKWMEECDKLPSEKMQVLQSISSLIQPRAVS
jgi:hypothetical protein